MADRDTDVYYPILPIGTKDEGSSTPRRQDIFLPSRNARRPSRPVTQQVCRLQSFLESTFYNPHDPRIHHTHFWHVHVICQSLKPFLLHNASRFYEAHLAKDIDLLWTTQKLRCATTVHWNGVR